MTDDDAAAVLPRGQPLGRSLLEILIAAGIVVWLYSFFLTSVEVRDEHMTPTLRPGQRVLVSRLPYRLTVPQRGDVVAVRNRIDPARIQLHRVIGLPGDVLDIRGAQVSVNGLPLREPYLLEGRERLNLSATTVGRYRLGPDDYFLLNDNRADLGDSRSFGAFSREQIVGRAWLIYWPPQDFAAVAHTPPTRGEP
ncbi:signal peptidase I [Candidatus Roseilinea sp. NK_OTU-006]|jgi:signal peptidase I|nr:signal peptidase I [Candidatus Roseilinea sp. NK_OTU-006]